MGKERVSSLRSMGLGIRSEQDTDAEAADIKRLLPLDPQKPQKPGSCQQGQQSAVSSPVIAQAGGHQAPSDVATGCGQEALSLSGVQRRGTVGSELRFAPGWLRQHEQACWLLGWV